MRSVFSQMRTDAIFINEIQIYAWISLTFLSSDFRYFLSQGLINRACYVL